MVEKIKESKDKVLKYMDRELTKYGEDRMDVKTMGDLADIVKDLAEAEHHCWEAQYYRTVTEAMEGGSSGSSGYGSGGGSGSSANGGRMGYGMGGARRGYGGGGGGSQGYTDPVSSIREMMAMADPETKAKIRGELSGVLGM